MQCSNWGQEWAYNRFVTVVGKTTRQNRPNTIWGILCRFWILDSNQQLGSIPTVSRRMVLWHISEGMSPANSAIFLPSQRMIAFGCVPMQNRFTISASTLSHRNVIVCASVPGRCGSTSVKTFRSIRAESGLSGKRKTERVTPSVMQFHLFQSLNSVLGSFRPPAICSSISY